MEQSIECEACGHINNIPPLIGICFNCGEPYDFMVDNVQIYDEEDEAWNK